MSINGGKNEGPNASNEGAPKKINGKDDYTSPSDLQSMQPPDGCHWVTREWAEMLRDQVNLAIRGAIAPKTEILMEPAPDLAAKGWTALEITIGLRRFCVTVVGWKPIYSSDAQELFQATNDAWQACVPVDDAAGVLRELRGRYTLLTDDRRYAIDSLAEAERRLDAACVPLMDAIKSPANWSNLIPETAQIEGLWFTFKKGRVNK